MAGSTIMPAILPSFSSNARRRLGQVVERHHADQIRHRLRDAERLGHRVRVLARPDLRRVGTDGEHQRVVVTVIRALDLHDHLAAGVRAHETRGLERGLGAGVAEPPEREPEPFDQVLADRVEVLRRLREMRAERGLPLRSPRRSSGARGRRPSRRSPGGSRGTRCRRCPRGGCPVRDRCRSRAAARPANWRRRLRRSCAPPPRGTRSMRGAWARASLPPPRSARSIRSRSMSIVSLTTMGFRLLATTAVPRGTTREL